MKNLLLRATFFMLWAGFPVLHAGENEFHVFTNTKGQKLEARITAVEGGRVRIERRDGKVFNVPSNLFIPADRAFIAAWEPPASPAPAPDPFATPGAPVASSDITAEKVNEALGQPVFGDTHLWDDAPEEAAGRLEWPRESMIVGYNKNTNEIAFSDSWGERYMERWVTAKEAEDISQDWFYVVTF